MKRVFIDMNNVLVDFQSELDLQSDFSQTHGNIVLLHNVVGELYFLQKLFDIGAEASTSHTYYQDAASEREHHAFTNLFQHCAARM